MPARTPSSGDLFDLRQIHTLRWIAIAVEVALVWFVGRWLGGSLALVPALSICAAQAAVNGLSLAWFNRRRRPVELELFFQLLLDVVALTGVAHFAGGASNPIVTLYLPLLAIGSTILSARLATFLAVVSVACYSFIAFSQGHVHVHDAEHAFQVHLLGMWLIFVISAGIIVAFVLRTAAAVRIRDAQLASAREEAFRAERMIALGNLAAGAAHELGTPLATAAVLIGELKRTPRMPGSARADLDTVARQIQECKRIISQLTARAGQPRATDSTQTLLDDWMSTVVDRWQIQRAPLVAEIVMQGDGPAPQIHAHPELDQAVISVLNNAADASPGEVTLAASWDASALIVDVLDRGPGISPEVEQLLGRQPVTTHGEGRGLGIMLARSAVQRFRGTLSFAARPGGGTIARILIPLAEIRA